MTKYAKAETGKRKYLGASYRMTFLTTTDLFVVFIGVTDLRGSRRRFLSLRPLHSKKSDPRIPNYGNHCQYDTDNLITKCQNQRASAAVKTLNHKK